MSEITGMTGITPRRSVDRRSGSPSKPPLPVGEPNCLVLISLVASLLTGALAPPVTAPDGTVSDHPTAFGATDVDPSTAFRVEARLA